MHAQGVSAGNNISRGKGDFQTVNQSYVRWIQPKATATNVWTHLIYGYAQLKVLRKIDEDSSAEIKIFKTIFESSTFLFTNSSLL